MRVQVGPMSTGGHFRPGKVGRLCVLCCLVAMVWLLPTRAFAQLSEARRTAQRARGLALGGQCDQAIPSYDRAIQLSPSKPELLRERGACHETLGHRKAAADDYRAFCDAAPTAPEVPALRQRIAELEAPVAAPPRATPAIAPSTPPLGGGPATDAAMPAFAPPPSSSPPPIYVAPREEVKEDRVRFRGGVSAGLGGLFSSVITGFQAGFDGRIGVQVNDLLGFYVQPHLVFGPASAGSGAPTTVIGVLSATGMVDLTLFDSFFLGAGGGFGVVNNPYGPVVQLRAGGYPLVGEGESGGRRKGLMLGVDVRIYILDGVNVVEATGGIGYEAF
jgi:hypothetical protein